MDDVQLRRHSTAPRVMILDILGAEGDLDDDQILAAWTARRPGLAAAHVRRLPRMLGEILWRLLNLEWVTQIDGRYRLTALGRRAWVQARGDTGQEHPSGA
ncbi:hypothetical protein ASD65_10290 [Microbacterium sp. Root61]|uniref:hypothetical protein n=1 Tax=Microbacterium sp. Root61 TaxID=1736570 RepID=UPI00070006FB|nr:hypothetical protein [Microbacterium sp. Root61]KRA24766.1 hypothetical protein ASD65_10290 [Microbacterium sp. Root61]